MPSLPSTLHTVLDLAAVSLAAWLVIEALVDHDDLPLAPSELVELTGLDVDTVLAAVAALVVRGLVSLERGTVTVLPERADALGQLVSRVHADRTLCQRVLALAAAREHAAGRIGITIAWAPDAPSAPPAPHSLASTVPAARDPSRSAGRGAPAA